MVPRARQSISAWELNEIDEEAARGGSRGGLPAALRRRDPRRAPPDPERRLQAARPGGAREPTAQRHRALRAFCPRSASWAGTAEPGELELPARPSPTGGGPPSTPLRDRDQLPIAERAAELRRRHPAPRARRTKARPRPSRPCCSRAPRPAPLGHLSYSALASYRALRISLLPRARPRRAGGRAGGSPTEAIAPTGTRITDGAEGDDRRDARGRGAGTDGDAGTGARQRGARGARMERPQRLGASRARADRRAPRPRGASGRRAAWSGLRHDRRLDRWSRSRGELEGRRLRPEAPFALSLGGTVLRGNIDLLASGPGEVPRRRRLQERRPRRRGAAELGERYAAQRAIYALAVAEALGAEQVRTAHVFLEQPDEPVIEDFDARAVGRASAESSSARSIAARPGWRFEVAADPYPAMCFRCPAAARLCPRPAWRPDAGAVARERSPLRARLAIFGYGSLVSPESAALSLGRPVEPIRATLAGWRRGWTIERHNDRPRRASSPSTAEPLERMPRPQRRPRSAAPPSAGRTARLFDVTPPSSSGSTVASCATTRTRQSRSKSTATADCRRRSSESSPSRRRPDHRAPEPRAGRRDLQLLRHGRSRRRSTSLAPASSRRSAAPRGHSPSRPWTCASSATRSRRATPGEW